MKYPRRTLALAVLSLTFSLGGQASACNNVEIARAASPSGELTAVMFNRNCGATTSFSTQISIVAGGQEASDIGNIFRADTDHGKAQTGHWGGPWAEMKWLAPDRLTIRYAKGARLFEQQKAFEDVEITFEAR